jgi:hypothetical protein
MRLGLFWLTGCCLAQGIASSAHGYECSPVSETDPTLPTQVWRQNCIPFAISSQSALLQDSALEAIVVNSFEQWSQNTHSCTSLSFVYSGYVSDGFDFDDSNPSNNRNVVTSLDTQAALDQARVDGFWESEKLVAITLTRFVPSTGEIVDADIVLNNVLFSFEEIPDGTSCGNNTVRHDLKNTLVHEVGHLIGFAHVDGLDATMFKNAQNCETKKRDLETDDLSGLCSVYPSSGPIVTCQPPQADYESAGTQGFRNQCSRVQQAPIDGCDCDTVHNTSHNKSQANLLFFILGLFCFRRRQPKKSIEK